MGFHSAFKKWRKSKKRLFRDLFFYINIFSVRSPFSFRNINLSLKENNNLNIVNCASVIHLETQILRISNMSTTTILTPSSNEKSNVKKTKYQQEIQCKECFIADFL